MVSEHPAGPLVALDGAEIVLDLAGAPAVRLAPDAAELLAQRLLDAVDQVRARQGGRPKPPFPPADLVSPHGAG